MASIRSTIELVDSFSNPLNNIVNAVNASISVMDQMQESMNRPIDTDTLEAMQAQLNEAKGAAQQLQETLDGITSPTVHPVGVEQPQIDVPQGLNVPITPVITGQPQIDTPENINVPVTPVVTEQPQIDVPESVEVPIVWQSNAFDVFTNSGVDRFNDEVQSANAMLNTLNETQNRIAETARGTDLFPANAVSDMAAMQNRLQAIQQRIQQIESNPVNLGTDTANAELEQMRARLQQAISEQEALNRAVDGLDIQAANDAYLRLANTIAGTEQYIRDNVDEQGRFNREIQNGIDKANGLQSMIRQAVGAFAGIAGVRKASGFIKQSTELFDTQRNAELQLMSVLANTLDADYIATFKVEADTTAAVAEINAIQDGVNAVEIPVTAETQALTAAYDKIAQKASEIQSKGIYGDEAMIAAGAEFSTYFSDTDAIETMMDTLANYAMGMSGGGAIDSTAMVDYATNLGKIMSGSYDAMTKKGFEFTKAQKAIIEGTATQQQIIDTLGKEYVSMSDDMKAAAVISQIINESWAGLYETMSDTPQGKIIQLNNALGDMQELVGQRLYPYIILFVNAIINNWGTIEGLVNGFTTALQYVLGVLSWLVEGAINFAQIINDNWGWISPIIYGIAAALAVYYGAQLAANAVTLISKGIHAAMAVAAMIHAAAMGTLTTATAAEIAAQYGLNAALYACPVVWIVIAIIALIAAFYAAVAAVNKFAGTSVSATGVIMGAFAALLAFVANTVVVPMYNLFATFVNFLANAFNDPVAAVKVAFYDMCLTVIGYIQNLASAIETLLNKIPGVQVDITSGLDSFYRGLEEAQQAVKDESGWTEYVQKMDFIDLPTAAKAGYEFGQGIEDTVSGFFDPASLFNTVELPQPEDYAPQLAGMGSDLGDISSNVGKGLSDSGEELKYLRDIAEQEVINRFTTAEIHIEQHNENNISSEMDLDGVTAYMVDGLEEAVAIAAEGVHT